MWHVEIVSVGPAKEPEKKKEEPKKDEAKKDAAKKDDKKEDPNKQVADLVKAYQAYNPHYTTGASQSNYGEYDILEITYKSWDMFETMWKEKISDKNGEFLWRCFQFCYLFPKNYEFHKDDIVHLWMVERFIAPSEAERNTMFETFQRMSIFQFSCLDYSIGGPRYRMNPSIIDLLEQRHDDKYYRGDDQGSHISENTLYISLSDVIAPDTLHSLYLAEKLSTLMVHGSHINQVPRDLFIKLGFIRVIDFSHTSITELPSSIRNLKDLKYLNVSGTPIKSLPKSLCSLYQMQTLKLRDCRELADLPKGMRKLLKLRHLDVSLACLLVSMPPGIGDLTELQLLPAFVVGKENGWKITELKHMVNLQGTLHILRLENVFSWEEAKEAALDQKIYLKKLEFQWSDFNDGLEILENLRPHKELKELQIVGYGDTKFPSWIGDPIFSKLVTISIHDCKKCELLPPLGRLPLLNALSISEMHEVRAIDHRFCGREMDEDNTLKVFPKLESLTLNGMPKLEKWSGVMEGNFPCLQKMSIFGCSKLIDLPQVSLLTSLQRLEMRFCPLLEPSMGEELPNSLQDVFIVDCPLLKEWCQKEGEEWRNLYSIPNVWIDYQQFIGTRGWEFLGREDRSKKTTQPSEIEPVHPLEVEPTKPSEVGPTQPSEAESAPPSETEPTHASEIESVQPFKTEQDQPCETKSGQSSKNESARLQGTESDQPAKSEPHKRFSRMKDMRILVSSGVKKMVIPWRKATTDRVDGLLRYKDMGHHVHGKFSMAVVQAYNLLEDQCQLESGSLSSRNLGPRGTFVGIYDGHGGPETALFIEKHLFNNIKKFTTKYQNMSPDVILQAYAATEEEFLCLVQKQWDIKPHLAAVGSCCLVGIVCDETLYIANVGNSRVVLGRSRKASKDVTAIQLTMEHSTSIQSVREELQKLHPNDPKIVVLEHGVWRVKGIIQISRSIGDAYLKKAEFNRSPLYAKYRLPEPFEKPILSSEPSLLVQKLQPEDQFLIFASDGLWEYVSNEEAVDIVNHYPREGIARRLVKASLKMAARKRGMKLSDLEKIDRGVRRHFHDDISVIVLFLDYDTLSQSLIVRETESKCRSSSFSGFGASNEVMRLM